MAGFDPVEWTRRFERLGGVITFRHAPTGSELWTGVMRLTPDDGAEAEQMKAELADHPDWQGLVAHYAQERLGAVQRA
jgi:hypothetical protein